MGAEARTTENVVAARPDAHEKVPVEETLQGPLDVVIVKVVAVTDLMA